MAPCIPGREVCIALRWRTDPADMTHYATVVIPSCWTKGRFLAYCRREHPKQTVKIATWGDVATGPLPWDVIWWLPNPEELIK